MVTIPSTLQKLCKLKSTHGNKMIGANKRHDFIIEWGSVIEWKANQDCYCKLTFVPESINKEHS